MSIKGSSSGEVWTTSRSKVGLRELAPVGGRASGGRHRRRLERLAHVREDLSSRERCHPGLPSRGRCHPCFPHAGEAILAFLMRAKPSWPSSACEPPFRSEPAPAGGLRRYAMSRMSPPRAGHTSGNASSIRAKSLTRAMREVSWERVAAIASPSASCADGAADDSARTLSCCGAGVFGAAARGPQDDPKTRAA